MKPIPQEELENLVNGEQIAVYSLGQIYYGKFNGLINNCLRKNSSKDIQLKETYVTEMSNEYITRSKNILIAIFSNSPFYEEARLSLESQIYKF